MESFQFLSRFNFYQLLLLALFLAAAFLASGLARGFAAAAFLATALFGAAFFLAAFGASSSPSAGVVTTGFSRFGRGPTVGLLLSVRISVMRSPVDSSRSRPRTGPGRLFLQSLWIQFPRDREAIP